MTFWDQTVTQLFFKGGFAMWPLLLCSAIGAAIMAERTIYFLRIRLSYDAFVKQLKERIRAGDLREAAALCRKHPNPVPHMAEHYLKHLNEDALRDDILKREGSMALEKVETRLRALAAITHITPLLGLLGTVTGLVGAFHKIEVLGGQVQPSDLASGIWEALITTVFGLVIAIPCMTAYHTFESAADRIARRMQFMVSELDEWFGKHSTGNFKADDTEKAQEQLKAVR